MENHGKSLSEKRILNDFLWFFTDWGVIVNINRTYFQLQFSRWTVHILTPPATIVWQVCCSSFNTSEVSRMKVFVFVFKIILIRFRLSDMICCYDLFMSWFCCYVFDMVSVMILICFQLWFLMWVKLVIWSQPIRTISKIFQNRINTISKSYQKRIKIISKHIKTTKTFDKSTKNQSLGCFCFFFWS